jgi:hypothetical protein
MGHTRVFIGYGYHDRDLWVEKYVVPFVTAFGCTPVDGREVFGAALSSEVTQQIHSCHAMIGFTTRRDPAGHDAAGNEKFTTHDWVVQELITALTHTPPIPFVEIREQGVVSPGGMIEAANFQRIDYIEADRAGCLVKIAQALQRFRVVRVRLPDTLVDQIEPLLEDPSFLCRCQIFRGAAELQPQPFPVLSVQGALCVDLRGIREGDLVKILISAGGRVWRSAYESVDTVDIRLKG